jgi:hypothetical protein
VERAVRRGGAGEPPVGHLLHPRPPPPLAVDGEHAHPGRAAGRPGRPCTYGALVRGARAVGAEGETARPRRRGDRRGALRPGRTARSGDREGDRARARAREGAGVHRPHGGRGRGHGGVRRLWRMRGRVRRMRRLRRRREARLRLPPILYGLRPGCETSEETRASNG